jgi:hypothetical protein
MKIFLFILFLSITKISAATRLNQVHIDIDSENYLTRSPNDTGFLILSFLGKQDTYNIALVNKDSIGLLLKYIDMQKNCPYCNIKISSEDFLSQDIQHLACSCYVHKSCLLNYLSNDTDEEKYLCKNTDCKKLIYYEEKLLNLIEYKIKQNRIISSVMFSTCTCFFYAMLLAMCGVKDYKSLYTFTAVIPLGLFHYILAARHSVNQRNSLGVFSITNERRLEDRLKKFYLKNKFYRLLRE